MIKRVFCLTILVSMTLHCASRLGILSYLYANRDSIAVAIGFTAEKSIAVCDSDYFNGETLIIEYKEGHSTVPALIHAHEINLFVIAALEIPSGNQQLLEEAWCTSYLESHIPLSLPSVFHPPAVA